MAIGILLGNLGTPASPSVSDVRAYLREFLMDRFVIQIPAWQRWILVNLIIAPFRAPKSAEAYASVWMDKGSPLLVYSERLRDKLQVKLEPEFRVALGMRYGQPSIFEALKELKECDSIILAPLYPQFAWSSYETWIVEAREAAERLGVKDKVRELKPFFNDPHYLSAQLQVIEQVWKARTWDHLLFSFHGLPESHVAILPNGKTHSCLKNRCSENVTAENEGCYRSQCYFVARTLAAKLGLNEKQWSVGFQSRLGREPWIGPYTDEVVPRLAENHKDIAVAMPAFTADCLETVEEIGMRAKEQFIEAGGRELTAIPCMNAQEPWVNALAEMLKALSKKSH